MSGITALKLARKKHKLPVLFSRSGFLFITGVTLAILFHFEVYLPLRPGIILLLILSMYGLMRFRISAASLLSRLMLALYALPFSSLIGYLFSSDYYWWDSDAALPLIDDPLIMRTLISIGVLGLLGLLFGYSLVIRRISTNQSEQSDDQEVLVRPTGLLAFWILLLSAVFLSWIAAPGEMILKVQYASSSSLGQALNFNGAALISYSIITLLMLDLQSRLGSPKELFLKKSAFWMGVGFIVIYLQLLRGDRESLGMITTILALYITGPENQKNAEPEQGLKKRVIFSGLITLVVLICFLAIGSLRYSLSDLRETNLLQELAHGARQNTWTSVLLNNLGSAAQYQLTDFDYLYGQTYVDYFLSLPPGILAQSLGYQRPIEFNSGPSWWFQGIASGGMHPVVVPFHNFGAIGAFLIMALWGYLIGRVESGVSLLFWPRFFYGSFISFSFAWFWYSDLNLIRGIMAICIVGLIYRILGGRPLRQRCDQLPHSELREDPISSFQ